MARFNKIGPSSEEQLAQRADRDVRRYQAGDKLLTAAREEHDHETARTAKVQKELGITPFAFLPESKQLLDVERALQAGAERLRDEIALLNLQRALYGRAPQRHRREELVAREKELKSKLGKDTPKEPATTKPGDLPEEVRLALAALAADGVALPKKEDEGRAAALQEKLALVESALFTVGRLIDQLRSDLALGVAQKIQKAHRAEQLALFRAAQAFVEQAERERLVRSALTAAGYSSRSDLLPEPEILGAILTLGSELQWGDAISVFRRALEARNVL